MTAPPAPPSSSAPTPSSSSSSPLPPPPAADAGRPVVAEIVTIGDELVLGETLDTNARDLARLLRGIGVAVARHTAIGDDVAAIAAAVREAAGRVPIVVTTGGLGPTFDDPTREAVARAAGVATAFDPALWADVEAAFARFGRPPTDNNRVQARLPVGASAIRNPVGTAPGFWIDVAGACVVCLPGVPREMRYLAEHVVVPMLAARFGLTDRLWLRTLHVAGRGESAIDDRIADVAAGVPPGGPVAIGLAAHPGVVDIRLTARAADRAAADALVAPLEAALRARLGDDVFGADDDTLAGVALAAVAARGWRLAAVEAGVGGALAAALAPHAPRCAGVDVAPAALDDAALAAAVAAARAARGAAVGLGASLARAGDPEGAAPAPGRIAVVVATPDGTRQLALAVGGHADHGPARAAAAALDALRRAVGSGP